MESIAVGQLKLKLQEWLKNKHYAANTVKSYMSEFSQLEKYIKGRGLNDYSESVGQIYQSMREQQPFKRKTITEISRSVLVWNLLLNDSDIPNRRKAINHWLPIPDGFKSVTQSFMIDAMARCNKQSTLREKERICSYFFNTLHDLGCNSCKQLNANIILKAVFLLDPSWRGIIRLILCHIYDNGFTNLNFSGLVPRKYNVIKIPDVYSKEEIELTENSFNINTNIGKRNLAIFKMASREALRSLDIATLKTSSVDFENNHLQLIQKKTNTELNLPLFPDVKSALLDYIEFARPSSDSEYVFLRERAPHNHISRQNVYTIISRAIISTGINTKGKRKGGHSLRASNATHKVNSGMRYDQVQKSMGHSGRETLKHYAKLDINNLRKCALSPPSVDDESTFGHFLRGEKV